MNYYTARFTEMVCRDRQVTISNLVHHVHTRLSLLQCDWSSQIPEHGQETPLRTPVPLCTCTRVRDPRLRPKLNRDGLGMGSALACGGLRLCVYEASLIPSSPPPPVWPGNEATMRSNISTHLPPVAAGCVDQLNHLTSPAGQQQ